MRAEANQVTLSTRRSLDLEPRGDEMPDRMLVVTLRQRQILVLAYLHERLLDASVVHLDCSHEASCQFSSRAAFSRFAFGPWRVRLA